MNIKKSKSFYKFVLEHVSNNAKQYIFVAIIFVIGIFLGVLFVNNSNDVQIGNISKYINDYMDNFSKIKDINDTKLLTDDIKPNIILMLTLWFAGTTIIGLPIVLIAIGFKGFCLGYTISSIALTLGNIKSIIFVLLGLLLQNIFFITGIFIVGVSSINICNSILKNKKVYNIKIEILKHTIMCFAALILILIGCVIKIKISTNILLLIIKYF